MTDKQTRHDLSVSGIKVRVAVEGRESDTGPEHTSGTLTGLATCRSTAVEAGCVLIRGYGTGFHSSLPKPVASSSLADRKAKRISGRGGDSGQDEPYLNQGLISSLPNWRLSSIIWCASLAPSRG